jgi:hypothetical protein
VRVASSPALPLPLKPGKPAHEQMAAQVGEVGDACSRYVFPPGAPSESACKAFAIRMCVVERWK